MPKKKPETRATLYQCQDCCGLWDEEDLKLDIPHLYERVSPGEPMPAGECPGCGALCHKYEEKYAAACPKCQEEVDLVVYEYCRISGSNQEGRDLPKDHTDTRERNFVCNDGCGPIPTEWVIHRMSREDAVRRMELRNNSETAFGDSQLRELEKFLEAAKKPEDVLDELVHDLKSGEASAINNDGSDSQIRFLIESLGFAEANKQIREL